MTTETLVAGIDSSTQSTKVLLVRAEDGKSRRSELCTASSRHRSTSRRLVGCAPAGRRRTAGARSSDRRRRPATRNGGLDSNDEVVRPALLWNDLRSAPQITTVIDHLGGPQATADTIGSVPAASFTITKLRWLYENEPDNARRTRHCPATA